MAQIIQNFIGEVKKVVKNQPIPPRYKPDEWKGKRFNCYAYAMRICMNLSGFNVRPGFICEKKDYKITEKCTLKYFLEDCEALGLQANPTTLEEPLSQNEYKIAVYVREMKYNSDFHFARQDDNGKWSEKNGWNKEITTLSEEKLMKNENGYKLIGVFKVSKK